MTPEQQAAAQHEELVGSILQVAKRADVPARIRAAATLSAAAIACEAACADDASLRLCLSAVAIEFVRVLAPELVVNMPVKPDARAH